MTDVCVCALQERPYICGLCGDTFAQKDDLLVHTASHSNTSIIRPSDTAGPSSTAMVATAKLAASSASCDASPPEQPPALPSNNRASSAGPQTPSGVPGGSSSAAATATASASVPRLGSGSSTRTVVFHTFPSASASTSVPGVSLPEVGPRKRSRSPRHDAGLSTSPQAKRAAFTRSPHADVPREMSPRLDEATLHSSSSSGPSGLSGPVEDSAAAERPHPDQSRLLAASHRPAGSWVSGWRPSHNGENAPSDTTSAPAGPRNESRPQGREARGSERSRERRPTICRQEEIEIGDQDLAAEDFVDDDDAVFADRVHSHGSNDGLKGGGVVVSQFAAPATRESGPGPDPSQLQSSVSVKSSVTVVDSASAAAAGEEKREVSGGSACSVSAGETALRAETCPSEAVPPGSVKPFQPVPRQEPPEPLRCDKDGRCQSAFVFRPDRKSPELGNAQSIGGAQAGAPHSLLDVSQGPEAAAQASATCGGGSLGTAAPPDLCAASHSGALTEAGSRGTSSSSSATLRQTHASLPLALPLPPNQPPRPSSADKAEAADRADAATQDELMDSEVQSYFADHVDADSPSISSAILLNDGDAAAILMNDRDSDDPQLLVCEEEMAESWKDSGSDMEEGGGEGGNLGAKHTEWDEWGSLGVPMQSSENEPDLAPPQAGILSQQRM